MSAKVISIINYKGGVGKTVSTYNIAFGLSFLNDHKVLIVDLDPQCSLSTICMRALSKTTKKIQNVADLKPEQTINSVVKDYLSIGTGNPNVSLKNLISKNFYTTSQGSVFSKVDFIPATMYDDTNKQYEKGLDDLEVEIIRNFATKMSSLELITIFARLFVDTGLNDLYDFILFDCPPANNIITQNALLVSDYYLIPTIMDDISSNGINHLKNVIEKTVYQEVYDNNKRIIDNCDNNSHLKFLKKAPKLLGIFETLRKSQVLYNQRYIIEEHFGSLLFEQIIYHHKPTAEISSEGTSCFSAHINSRNLTYSPHMNYGNLVFSILSKLNIPRTTTVKVTDWL